MKKIITFSLVILLIASCSDDPSIIQSNKPEQTVSKETRDQLKTAFGSALAKALADSPPLRELLKAEALKMFNNDYDILYHVIKDTRLTNGQTVREVLLSYFEKEKQLQQIESELPLLTIFVPVLPENTFSASVWDTDNQIPSVGITSFKTNDVKIIDHNGEAFVLKADEIPAFPVVVIKENERVIQAKKRKGAHARGKSFRTSDGMDFVFLADCFDGSIKTTEEDARLSLGTDQKLIDAYNIYLGTDGWHRDYIYYNISPSQDRGPFSYAYAEHIRSFAMQGDPVSAYSKISDQTGDPVKRSITGAPNSGWTGGYYEFKVRVLLNAKNGVGEELVTYFSALPDELFVVEYEKFVFYYRPKITGFYSKGLSLPLFPWDLNDYASTIKIEVEEVDVVETIVQSESRTVKFATNFGIEGTLKKIGLKFGASLEETRVQSMQRTYTAGNDLLGAVVVNFADNVVTSGPINLPFVGSARFTREYSTGWYTISVEPKRVQ